MAADTSNDVHNDMSTAKTIVLITSWLSGNSMTNKSALS
jgi:hypothetical protein